MKKVLFLLIFPVFISGQIKTREIISIQQKIDSLERTKEILITELEAAKLNWIQDQIKKEFDLKEQDQVALMVARLIESKGIRDFMNAAIDMKSLAPNIKFLLVAPIESQSWEAIAVDEVKVVEKKRSNLIYQILGWIDLKLK